MESEVRPLDVGTEFGDEYRIDRVLGAGGFGITYEVVALRNIDDMIVRGRRYAIKEFAPLQYVQRASDGIHLVPLGADNHKREENWNNFLGWRAEFHSEARTLARMTVPGIADVLMVRSANGTEYFVMEFIHGHSLFHAWKSKKLAYGVSLTWPEVQSHAEELLNALEHVHDNGIVHRDIKPQNIMLRNGSTPVLIDFGGARPIAQANELVVSTPGFAPAEQISGMTIFGKIGEHTDIYSLAASLYFVMTGNTPYQIEQGPKFVHEPLIRQHPDRAQMRIPDRAAAAIDSALDFADPRSRPQTVAKWRAAFGFKKPKRARSSPATADGPEPIFKHAERLRRGDDAAGGVAEAIREYERAAELDYAPAQYRLGRFYQTGKGVRRDPRKAHELFIRAAAQGNVRAQYRLSEQYLDGDGVNASTLLAMEYARKASDQRHPAAMNLLGRFYRKGIGVEQSDRLACKWYRRSACAGNPEATANLASMYERGLGVARDQQMATRLKDLAGRMGGEGKAAETALNEVRRILDADRDSNG